MVKIVVPIVPVESFIAIVTEIIIVLGRPLGHSLAADICTGIGASPDTLAPTSEEILRATQQICRQGAGLLALTLAMQRLSFPFLKACTMLQLALCKRRWPAIYFMQLLLSQPMLASDLLRTDPGECDSVLLALPVAVTDGK